MSYSLKTEFYGLQYPKSGEKGSASGEQSRMTIIDNQLFGALNLISAGVLDEGGYQAVYDNTNLVFTVSLKAVACPSLLGIINRGLVKTNNTLLWMNLSVGTYYYLYVLAGANLYEDPTDIQTVVSTTEIDPLDYRYLLLATFTSTSSVVYTLDQYPTNKRYVRDLLAHVATTTDPHSPLLTQTNLVVTNSLRSPNTVLLGDGAAGDRYLVANVSGYSGYSGQPSLRWNDTAKE